MNWWKRLFSRRVPSIDPAHRERIRAVLSRHMRVFGRLPDALAQRLMDQTGQFLAEKEFIGRNGLILSAEDRILIAGHACLLTAGMPEDRNYRRMTAVSVHAQAFGESIETRGPTGQRFTVHDWAAGRAWSLGFVELAWDSVRRSVAYAGDGFNVIYHEFAHVLDGADGQMGGTPPLPTRAREVEWQQVMSPAYERLRAEAASGPGLVMSDYATTSPVEFFAVSVECFFERPTALREWNAEWYDVLVRYFGQDPREYEISGPYDKNRAGM